MIEKIKIKRIKIINMTAAMLPRFVVLDTEDNIYNYQADKLMAESIEHTFDVLSIAQEGDILEIEFSGMQVVGPGKVGLGRYFILYAKFVKESLQ